MFKSILIPVALDHDVDVNNTIAIAQRLRADGRKITLVAVVEDIPSYVAEYVTVKPISHVQSDFKDRLRSIAKGQKNMEIAVLSGKPGVAIPDLAEETDADLIIIGSHRPGVEDYFLGSTSSRVVRLLDPSPLLSPPPRPCSLQLLLLWQRLVQIRLTAPFFLRILQFHSVVVSSA